VLKDDVARLSSPPPLEGVLRLLPPYDPMLQLRDRETLIAEEHHRRLWRSMHNPGVVLADGHVVASWKARKSGRTLAVTVEPLESPLRTAQRDAIVEEATHIAPLRECTSADVTFAG
jgi:Winged helix DNA-binding domain